MAEHAHGPHAVQQQGDEASDPSQQNYKLFTNVMGLLVADHREHALYELSKKREQYPDLAPTLWYSVGVMAALLQEVISVYNLLHPADLAGPASNRVCNALALLQCVASHPETRMLCIRAHLPLFLYPFLNTATKTRPFEYLRLTSLGVIGALVKADDAEVVKFLLSTEIIPLCLRIMETGSELSKTVATFIVQKILLFDIGLQYLCATPERFYAVSTVLCKMTTQEKPPARLLKHVIRCYLRLSDHSRARDALKHCLPDQLRDATFSDYLGDDLGMRRWLFQLLLNIGDPNVTALQQQQQQQQAAQQVAQNPTPPPGPPPGAGGMMVQPH